MNKMLSSEQNRFLVKGFYILPIYYNIAHLRCLLTVYITVTLVYANITIKNAYRSCDLTTKLSKA